MDIKHIKAYGVIFLGTIFTLGVINVFNISYPIAMTTTSRSTELAVVGEGKIEVTPDTAYVDVGITITNAASVKDVENTINSANNKIIESMQLLAITKDNIKTSNYSIFPDYAYENNTNRIRGYNGNVTIAIKVTDPEKVASVVESATASGANQVNGVRFAIDKPELYREKAREKAIENAREQAQKLAKSLGIRLGRIVNIVESSPMSDYGNLSFAAERVAMGGGGSQVIEPGTQTISSTVTLYFDKK